MFPVGNDFTRPVSSSQWTSLVKAIFKRHAGTATCPKTLRASYVCWLKSKTDCPDILKAAASESSPFFDPGPCLLTHLLHACCAQFP